MPRPSTLDSTHRGCVIPESEITDVNGVFPGENILADFGVSSRSEVECVDGRATFEELDDALLSETLDGKSDANKKDVWKKLSKEKDEEDEGAMKSGERYMHLLTEGETHLTGFNRRFGVGFICDFCGCSRQGGL